MANADADTPPRSLRDYFERTRNFRGNGQHAHVPARRLPETIENLRARIEQELRRMHSPPFVAEKRALQMNAQRLSLDGIAVYAGVVAGGFDPIR